MLKRTFKKSLNKCYGIQTETLMINFPFQWVEPKENYKKLYKTFLRTPVRLDGQNNVDPEATYDDPKKIFPDSYVDFIGILYGKEKKKRSMISIRSI